MASALKKSVYASEQDRPDVATARERWVAAQKLLDPDRLIFIDETGTSTNMARLRGRCRRGERLIGKVPHGHWKITTFVAGLRRDAITAPFVIDQPMNSAIFKAYLVQCLVPTSKPGDIVVMDNLSSHKSDRGPPDHRVLRAQNLALSAALFAGLQPDRAGLLEAQGAFAKGIRAIRPRAVGSHWCESLDTFSAAECQNFFRHAGYA